MKEKNKNFQNSENESNQDLPNEETTINGNGVEGQESETDKLKKELEIQKDKYVRLFAEFDNYKRRNSKERIELMQTAGKEVITSMLEVLDDVDRAEKQMNPENGKEESIEHLKEGVQLVFNKLRNTLQSRGLKPMESIGTDFDVHLHEAVAEVPAGEDKKGKVIDEIVKGYYLNDKLIRHAKVVVGK